MFRLPRLIAIPRLIGSDIVEGFARGALSEQGSLASTEHARSPDHEATLTNRVRFLGRRVRGGCFGVDRGEARYRFDPYGSPSTHRGLAAMTDAFNELAVHFGRSASLMGILSRPSAETPIRRPAVVILNTGIAHRVGHHRMYVKMARELAGLGHLVFRFDFSGIGDSASRGTTLDPIEAHQADVSEALDWLTASCNVNEVVLIGLCAGAEIALRYGHSDKRVTGLVLLDPTIPPTARFYAHYIGRRTDPATELVVIRQRTRHGSGEELSERARIGLRRGRTATCERSRSQDSQRARAIVSEVSQIAT